MRKDTDMKVQIILMEQEIKKIIIITRFNITSCK